MFKKIIATLMIVGLGFGVGTFEATYTRKAVCVGAYNGLATFEDSTGNCWDWEMEQGEDFEIGCSYKLVMDDNHSSQIEDDWIKKSPKKIEKRG